ncbi:MAG: PGPGW domain-containing protein [Planctomycetota bacterium]
MTRHAPLHPWVRSARRSAVLVLGYGLLIAGLILWPTPIPLGVVFVPLALVILSSEARWARRHAKRLQRKTGRLGRRSRVVGARVRRWSRGKRPDWTAPGRDPALAHAEDD